MNSDRLALKSAIIADLTPLWQPGQVAEVRIPIPGRYKRTDSGYFNDPEALANAIATKQYNGTGNIYRTLNPVKPELQARASNRIQESAKETTADSSIVHRRWFPIDLDPDRSAGISSTDLQHQKAHARAQAVRTWLGEQGWADPVYADSGNGAHLLYAIDLPNDDDARQLLQACLQVIGLHYSDTDVLVDLSCFNAARVWKLYGTTATKGDHTPERPHRQSRILEAPDELTIVTADQLFTLASLAPKLEEPPFKRTSDAHGFDIKQWLARYGLDVHGEALHDGGRKFVLEACPFNPDHGRDAAVFEARDGRLGFKCFHNGCAGHGWRELREKFDPKAQRTKRGTASTKGAPTPIDPPQAPDTSVSSVPVIDAGEKDPLILRAAAWDALEQASATDPRLYRYGSLPTRLEGDDDGRPILRDLQAERLRYELTNAARWIQKLTSDSGTTATLTRPPTAVVRDLLADPSPRLPVLARIVEAPVFASTGELQTTPGYHPASRTYHHAAPGFSLPDVPIIPTTTEIARARSLILDELLGDFPFAEQADRANAVALFLLPYARDFIPGATPLHMIEAPMPGSGKGLLASVILTPALGRPPATLAAANDDDEWRKRITAKLMSVPAALLIDNINLALDSAALANALTATEYEDRLLGRNENIRLPVRCVWLATANNPTMTTEIARRCVRIRLQPNTDRPYELPVEAFHHPHLGEWTEAHRAELVHAALTLIRAWLTVGRPRGTLSLGSYEHWAAVLGGILDAIGIPGFLANRAEFYEAADLEGQIWRRFVADWWERFRDQEVGTGDLFPLAEAIDGFNLGRGNERAQRTAFGMQLAKRRDSVIGDVRIMRTGQRQRLNQWRLVLTTSVSATIDQDVYLVYPNVPFDPHARAKRGDTEHAHIGPKISKSPEVHIGTQGTHKASTNGHASGFQTATAQVPVDRALYDRLLAEGVPQPEAVTRAQSGATIFADDEVVI